jgi:ubiquinone/menaquinone biosynthesis C-methylase UbiE
LIDIGCGMGFFIDLAKSHGWEVKGVEISDYAVGYAREKLQLDVIKSSLQEAHFETEYFDVATMWNVLDQLYDPKTNLKELNRILKKGGYVFARVSNLQFHLNLLGLYKRIRFLFKKIVVSPLVFHLYSFDKNSIIKLLESAGFSNVVVRMESLSTNNPILLKMFGDKGEVVVRMVTCAVVKIIYFLSFGRIIVSPSIFVIARKN